MKQKILIVDDHPLFREALTMMVQSILPECEISEAINYQQATDILENNSTDLVLIDLNMPGSSGLIDLAMITKMHPNTPFIIVSANEQNDVINACFEHNASGYIFKSASPTEIKTAINTVLSGSTYSPPEFNEDEFKSIDIQSTGAKKIGTLTPSQLRILIELGTGKLNKQIAYELDIKEATVKAHITSIFRKLGINNRTQAVLFVKDNDLKTTRNGLNSGEPT